MKRITVGIIIAAVALVALIIFVPPKSSEPPSAQSKPSQTSQYIMPIESSKAAQSSTPELVESEPEASKPPESKPAPVESKVEKPVEQKPAEPKVEAPPEDKIVTMVWIPKTGKKYHNNPSCSGMKNPTQVELSVAIARGYGPCKNCY